MEALFADHDFDQAMARCEAAGIPYAPISRPEDLFSDPQLNQGAAGLLPTTLPNGTQTRLPRVPIQMNDADFGIRRNPPEIGQDTDALLLDMGYGADEIDELRRHNAIA